MKLLKEDRPADRPVQILIACCCLVGALTQSTVSGVNAREPKRLKRAEGGEPVKIVPKTYRSRNFVLHTDLSKDEAAKLLKRLERSLLVASTYWRRPAMGAIECYVAKDVAKWPDSALPHPMARVTIARIQGATISGVKTKRERSRRQAVVYANAEPGVAEHEIVHAYCMQNFGEMGPGWYNEGMAELANHGQDQQKGVRCPKWFVTFFRESEFRQLNTVVNGGGFTAGISDALISIARQRRAGGRQASIRLWTKKHDDVVQKAKESYRWSWALCHLLSHNSNYSRRFRELGQGYLTNRGDSFENTFGPVRREVEFEYNFFMRRIDIGYQVDLCRWDWGKRFQLLKGRRGAKTEIHAGRGYQASGVTVESGKTYGFRSRGEWTTEAGDDASSADGRQDGQGRLMGVVMNGYRLSEPFELGVKGNFKAPSDGKLYLRCRDAWNQIADNAGSLNVQIQAGR